MKKSAIALVAIGFSMVGSIAVAQNVPMRDMDLLALNTDSPRDALDHAGRSNLIDSVESGGGSGAYAPRGVDGAASATDAADDAPVVDALPPQAIMPSEDPAQPAAPTPKRPSYRWQSLVPGAIK